MDIKYKELTVDNLFDCCSLLDAIGTEQILSVFGKDELVSLTDSETDAQGVGIVLAVKICGIVIKNIPKAKDEVCTFIANCIEWDNGTAVTVDEIRNMKAGTFIKVIKDFFKQDGITDFFKEVAGLLGLGQSDSGNLSGEDTVTLTVI